MGRGPIKECNNAELGTLDSLGPGVGCMKGVRSWKFFLLNLHLMD